MKLHERIKAQVQKAKLALQARNQARQTEAAAEQATLAEETVILDKHQQLALNLDNAEDNQRNTLSNLEAVLAKDPMPEIVARMRSYHYPPIEDCAHLATFAAMKSRKQEIVDEIKRQTVGLAQAALSEFESAHRDLLKRHGVV